MPITPIHCAALATRLLLLFVATTVTAFSAPLTIITASLPNAKYGNVYSHQIQVSGGTAPYNFYIDALDLPLGLGLNFTTGLVSGSPVESPGTYPFTVRVRDSSEPQLVVEKQLVLTVVPGIHVIGLDYLPPGTVGTAYSYEFSAEGGTAPYHYSIPSGSQPAGLLIGADSGVLSGTPVVRGSYTFTVNVTDSAGLDGAASFKLDISGLAFTLAPETLPEGRVGVAYTPVSFSAGGGRPPYSYAIISGTVPGLSLTAQGVLSGTPTTDGGFPFDLKVTDSIGNWWTFTRSVTVRPPISIEPDTLPDGELGKGYEAIVQTNGLRGDAAISVIAGSLPNGLSLAKLTDRVFVLQGTPSRAGTYVFTLKVQDSSGASVSRAYTVVIIDPMQQPLEMPPLSFSRGWVGEALSGYIGAIPGRYPITITVAAGVLPPGISMSSSGVFTGTPTTAGVYAFRLEARDSDNRTGTRDYVVSIFAARLTVSPDSIPAAQAGVPYSIMFTASGGVPPYTFAPTITGTPEMLTLSAGGVLTGTPPRATTTTFEVSVTDSQGNYSVRTYTLVVNGLVITTETLPTVVWGQPYSAQLAAANGVPPYTFDTGCMLPGGLTLSPSGLISGTPSSPGGSSCHIWVHDSAGNSNSKGFVFNYSQGTLQFDPYILPAGTVNIYYINQIAVYGCDGTVGFQITSGALPPGLSTNVPSPGYLRIEGVPSAAGSYPFRLKATCGASSASWDYTIAIGSQPVTVGPASLPSGTVWTPYSVNLTATGGTAPYGYQIFTGNLPPGLTLSVEGAIAGTPQFAGTFGFIAEATDSVGLRGTKPFQIVIADATLTLTPAELPNGRIHQAYSAMFSAAGGTGPYTYSIAEGSLPDGLTLSTGGRLAGTPTRAGAFSFRVNARDSRGVIGSRGYQLQIEGASLTFGPPELPDATPGEPYSAQLTVSGGTAPYVFALTYANPWVGGLQVNSDGSITGSPAANGPLTLLLTVTVTDADGSVGSHQYQIRLLSASLTITPSAIPDATANRPYDVSFVAVGGTPPYTFRISSGQLPADFTLGAQGRLFGTPASPGDHNFTLEVTDAASATASRNYLLHIAAAAPQIGPDVLPLATAGHPYAVTFNASGGTPPYGFSVASGTLPMGLVLASYGTLSGNLQQAGTYTFLIEATDASGAAGRRSYQLKVTPIELMPSSLGAAFVGKRFEMAIYATGGAAPYVVSKIAGTLPPGLSIQGGATFAGTPTVAGTYAFALEARDAAGATGSREYDLTVYPPGIALSPETLPEGSRGSAYQAVLTARGGTDPYTFSLKDGALPGGLLLEASGLLSGEPNAGGEFSFTVEARDATGATGTHQYSLAVRNRDPLSILTTWLGSAVVNSAFREELQASGGLPPYRWELASGRLPAGMDLTAAGLLAGTPQEPGSYPLSVRLADSAGETIEKPLPLWVSGGSTGVNTLFFDPPALTHSAVAGDNAGETTRCVAVFATKSRVDFNASLFTPGSAWARIASSAASTPGEVCVTFQPRELLPGTYRGELRLSSVQAGTPGVVVPLLLTVDPCIPPVLAVTPQRLRVQAAQGEPASVHSLWVVNEGAGTLAYTVEAPDVGWLAANPESGSASADLPSPVRVRVDPSAVPPGVYTADVTVRSGERTEKAAVELVVAETGGRLALSQSTVELVAWAGGSAVSSTVGLVNTGSTALPSILVSPISAEPGWLSAETTPAIVPPGSASLMTVSANPRGLPPGRYTGRIDVGAEGAVNSPQVVTAGLTVLAAEALLPADAPDAAAIFTPETLSRTFSLAVPPLRPLSFATITIAAKPGWVKITPASGQVAAGGTLGLTVSAEIAGLGAGEHQALVIVGFSDGTVRRIAVSLVVPPTAAAAGTRALAVTSPCGPGSTALHLISPPPDFQATAGKAVPVRAHIRRCDGNIPSEVRAIARTGTQTMTLSAESPGIWAATWIPEQPKENVRLEVTADAASGGVTTASVAGMITASRNEEPALAAAIHSATLRLGDPVAPGGWLTLFGSGLGSGSAVTDSPTLPVTLNGVSALIGGLPLRLHYAGPGQVNAVVPKAVPSNTVQQLLILHDGTPSAPLPVVVAEAQPGVFTMNQQGTGQAAALHAGTSVVVGPAAPSRRGEIIEVYCTGLGLTDVVVPDGEPAPLAHLARATIPVSAVIGGRPAKVHFAGLTPGTFGLYQVNVEIPSDAPSGGSVLLELTQGGRSANPVTIAIAD